MSDEHTRCSPYVYVRSSEGLSGEWKLIQLGSAMAVSVMVVAARTG